MTIYQQLNALTIQQLWVLAEEQHLTNYKHLQNVRLVELLMGKCIECEKKKKKCKGCGKVKKLSDPRRQVKVKPYAHAFGVSPNHRP